MPTLQKDAQILHFQHTLWQNELSFFEDELRIFERRLGELVQRVEDRTALAKLEHFQNQFIRQKEVLDELKHDIKVHDQALARLLQQDDSPDENDAERHREVDEQMVAYRKIYNDLKANFHQFMKENMG